MRKFCLLPPSFIFFFLFTSSFAQLVIVFPQNFHDLMSSSQTPDLSVLNVGQTDDTPYNIGPPTLEDLLPKEKDLTMFMDSLRDFPDVLKKISDPNETLTLFAPINRALLNLKVKPNAIREEDNDDEAAARERFHQFVLGHIVPNSVSLKPETSDEELKTLSNLTTIHVQKAEGKGGVKLNDDVNIVGKQIEAVNGILYKVDNVLVNI
ncbi:4359_t:CDS:2 [Ambispora gerdemannii]|uniref:4359_t:CDS:1 n=1 Tax=Ambispora gerdemannii TaxID=144530 RepID=A0A9N8YYX1_9GLOM|nr:4359_t:CDS:2 [Ambispora gerdemannii]